MLIHFLVKSSAIMLAVVTESLKRWRGRKPWRGDKVVGMTGADVMQHIGLVTAQLCKMATWPNFSESGQQMGRAGNIPRRS
jgi:hypothetical protein